MDVSYTIVKINTEVTESTTAAETTVAESPCSNGMVKNKIGVITELETKVKDQGSKQGKIF